MRGAERIVFTFRPFGEAGQAAALPESPDAIAPPGQNFVGIGLVADVPEETIAGRVEHVMEGDREFDDAKTGAKVAAGHRHGGDRLRAQFVSHLAQRGFGQSAQIRRAMEAIQQRR